VRILAVVLVALVGEPAAVEGAGLEAQARERGEDAEPAAGEDGGGRRVAERHAGVACRVPSSSPLSRSPSASSTT
jgi:hypothetical protein